MYFPPSDEELVGEYTSKHGKKEYKLNLVSDKTAKFEVKENKDIVYEEICENYHIEKEHYRIFPTYSLSFNTCNKMDSHTILERNYFFNILIGNNGTEINRIDPDANVYYRKSKN